MKTNNVPGVASAFGLQGAFASLVILAASTAMLAQAAPTPQAQSQPATAPATATLPSTAPARLDAAFDKPPTSQPADAVTMDFIQNRIAELHDAKGLDEKTLKTALTIYDQARDKLRQSDEFAARAAQMNKARLDAPAQLAAIKEVLKAPSPTSMPALPADVTQAQAEQIRQDLSVELSAAKHKLRDLDKDYDYRNLERRPSFTRDTDAIRLEFESLTQQKAAGAGKDPLEVATARKTLLRVQEQHLRNRWLALRAERDLYNATDDLIALQHDLAARQVNVAQQRYKLIDTAVIERQKAEALKVSQSADQMARDALATAFPVVKTLAQENADLARRRVASDGIPAKLETISAELDQTTAASTRVQEEHKGITDRMEAGGNHKTIGLLLRKKRQSLPDIPQLNRQIAQVQSEINRTQQDLIDLEDQRAQLSDLDQRVQEYMNDMPASVSSPQRQGAKSLLLQLLTNRRDYIDALIKDSSTYQSKLADLDMRRQTLVRATCKYRSFIEENILWISSADPLALTDAPKATEAIGWLGSPRGWSDTAGALWQDLRHNTSAVILPGLGLAGVVLLRRKARKRLESVGQIAVAHKADRIGATFEAFLLTLALAASLPMLVWIIHWRLSSQTNLDEIGRSIAAGLNSVAVLLLTLLIFIQVCRRDGLAQVHFGWPAPCLKVLRRSLWWLLTLGLPMAFIVAATEFQALEARKDSLGRMAFIVGMLVLSAFTFQTLRPSGTLMTTALARIRGGWIDRLKHVWFVVAMALPLLLAVMAMSGYYYTALQLGQKVLASVWLVLVLLLVNALLLRWLSLARRSFAMAQARKRALARQLADKDGSAAMEQEIQQDPHGDVSAMDAQTRQLLRYLMAAALLVGAYLIWRDVSPAVGMLGRVEVWTHSVKTVGVDGVAGAIEKTQPVTLSDLTLALIVAIMTVIASRNIPGLLEFAVLQPFKWSASGRYAFTAVTRYVITVAGIIVFFSLIGISWSSVQWLVAAMTVGLGFGLQEIFANFVSGLIVLFERPIRVGDVVTIGTVTGTVSKIRIRATTITDFDRKELIVPNKEFITKELVNWTLSDTVLRVVIPVGVAYGTDTDLARNLLTQVARDNPLVLKDPPPDAFFLKFGDSSLNLELRVFVGEYDSFMAVQHQLLTAIDSAFRKAGIDISFPQMDLHVRTFSHPLSAIVKKQDGQP